MIGSEQGGTEAGRAGRGGQGAAGARRSRVDPQAEALAEAQALFRSAFDQAPWGAAVVGLDGRFVKANVALCALTGFKEDELLGRLVVEITHPADRADAARRLATTLAGHDDGYDVEKRYIRADGRIIWVHVRTTLVRDTVGWPSHSIHHMIDISEQRNVTDAMRRALEREKTAAEELRRLDEDRSDFLTAVTHDFRTPLSSIVGFGSTLEDHWDQLADDERTMFLHRIVLNGEELDRRIANFLEYSQLDRGELSLECGPCDLGGAVAVAVERTRLILERHSVQVSVPEKTVVVAEERALSR